MELMINIPSKPRRATNGLFENLQILKGDYLYTKYCGYYLEQTHPMVALITTRALIMTTSSILLTEIDQFLS
ncbi:hypothetical protein BABINDRAFT_161143 [Babjeviella inositovora NRRL Y-12698]|uniref:Uncharacterized protein n=1 Tax=Babjeviella inositovora NRRL Y-12698 TaxID=984486 RepID=A0A1E3QRP6_9ASCO|nr:uncharacterized protein BABINDRAFT_161143 [Babjeviella inositovora NRRL Y-12698]ODQ80164.1 hypothetical protein BABINDRAFT_161143 [Babjeviella inositovora NRRL Y-12698]